MYSPSSNFVNGKIHKGNDCTESDTGYITPCWIWRKAKFKAGYGMLTISCKQYTVHVLNYIAEYGPIPDGCEIDHLCGVRPCVRPDHLEAVTHTDNVRRGARAKLTPEIVIEAKKRVDLGETRKSVAESFGVDPSVISEAVRGIIWRGVL